MPVEGKALRAALRVLKRLQKSGHEVYFAGGCVRDYLMGIEPEDYDIATSARPEEVMKAFPDAIPVGAEFGVVVVIQDGTKIQVATFRGESSYRDGRRPTRVYWSSAKRDVLRRDFTINGMLRDPITDRVIDYVGGKRDIGAGVIRCIGKPNERLREDKLRMVRALRFAARFSYRLEEETERAIRRSASQVSVVSPERLREELNRIITSRGSRRAFEEMSRLGILKQLLPEIESLRGAPQGRTLHPEGDVFRHSMLSIDFLREPSVTLAWGTLLHDAGKPEAYRKSRHKFAYHEKIGEEIARDVCKRFRFSRDETERIASLVRNHMYLLQAMEMRESTLKRLFEQPEYEELAELHRADALASGGSTVNYNYCQRKYREFLEAGKAPKPLINGHDLIALGLEPGPIFREILEGVREEQLEGKIKTKQSALALARKIATRRGLISRM